MQGCVERGCKSEGVLPGGLKVRRRAPGLFRQLSCETNFNKDPLMVMEWVDLFALAVNEENAAGGRVVTAPPMALRASSPPCCTTTIASSTRWMTRR